MPFSAATVGIITAVTAIAGAGLNAYSMIRQGSAQSAALKSQANAARYNQQAMLTNQQIAEQNARAVEKSGSYAEQIQREKNLKILGAQKTGFSKAGVVMEGTPLDVMAGTAGEMEQDIIAQRYNTDIQAWRYRSQGAGYGSQADEYGRQAGADLSMASGPTTAGYIGAGATLLTGAGKAVNNYYGSTYDPTKDYKPGGYGYKNW